MKRKSTLALGLLLLLGLLAALVLWQRTWVERQIVALLGADDSYAPSGDGASLQPTFEGPDSQRKQIKVALTEVATGFTQPVDLQFIPGQPDLMLVVQKTGQLLWVSLSEPSQRGVLLEESVVTEVEQGLLGLALHPDFARNGALFTNATVALPDGREVTQIVRWSTPPGADLRQVRPQRGAVLLEVEQPYQNHNAGQLAFGPDGYLYLGLGDGGLADDPRGHGQNRQTLLGSMLRIDVDHPGPQGEPYRVPEDNPFVGKPQEGRPEIWAWGLRNPWRYSFTPNGQLVVADVGQDRWEEISLLSRGQNHGWKIREADHCFDPPQSCPTEGLTDPIYSYPHQEGVSVTGGYVYTGAALPELKGLYVFADFVSGRIWAIPLPSQEGARVPQEQVRALGRWPLLISSFGQAPDGQLYLADFTQGRVLRLEAP